MAENYRERPPVDKIVPQKFFIVNDSQIDESSLTPFGRGLLNLRKKATEAWERWKKTGNKEDEQEAFECYLEHERELESKKQSLYALTPEGREISFDLKEQLRYWSAFYTEHNIDWVSLPETISLTREQISQMKELMEQGFDKMLIIPANLVGEPEITLDPDTGKPQTIKNEKYQKLHKLMSQEYNPTFTGRNYDSDGKFQGSQDTTTKLPIILTKDVQNLEDDPLFKETLNQSIDDLNANHLERFSGFSESVYLVYQREYFERTGKHLDKKGYTWLPESSRPLSSRVPGARWIPGYGGLRFNSYTPDYRLGHLGCRLAGVFEIEKE